FICNAIYRLTVHPLAKYPGPFWQKLSDWPLIFQCSAGDRHLNLLQAHEKYGSVVRTGPNTLSFNTATALYAIHTDRNANVKRAEWYKTLDASTGGFSTQSVIDKHEHAFRRRIMSQAFSEKALRDAEKFIANNVRTLIHGIGEGAGVGEWTTARNFSDWATWYGFDFIGDLSFGSSFDLLTSDEHRYVPGVLMGTSKFLYYAGYLPFAFLLRPILGTPILSMLGSQAAKDSVKFTNLANSRLEARIALSDAAEKSGQETRKDIFHHLLSARDPETGRSFTMTQLQADSGLLIAAGSDGVALTLSGCLFYLLRNPHTYEKLVAEIRSAFDDAEDIGMPKLASLTYLTACIDETLRISPALPSAMPREVLPGGLSVDGLHIPSGIDVGVAAYCIQHNSTYYPSPWAFRPERWI
ncbi:cytochrome P450, partial [Patellaria atrata CBS 101060]